MKKILTYVFATLLMAALLGSCLIWRSPGYYAVDGSPCDVMDSVWWMEQYGEVISSHPRPYIFTVRNGGGAALVYGSTHTINPADDQMADIEKRWNDFKPTVALVEGRLGFLFPGVMDPVRTFGEMGKVAQLARKEGLELYSWDVSKEDLAVAALRNFSREQVAVGLILNPYFGQLRFAKPDSPEKYIMDTMDRASYVGLEKEIRSYKDIDLLWNEFFPEGPDWRDVSDEWRLPGYLQKMWDEFNLIRNEKLVCTLAELVNKGERVFIIAGSSHAVCIHEAARSLFD